MVTPEKFASLFRAVVAKIRGAGEGSGGGWRKVSVNAFSRLKTLAIGEEDWKDFEIHFAVIWDSGCLELRPKFAHWTSNALTWWGLENFSMEIDDQHRSDQDGILARYRLYRDYQKTLARVLTIQRDAMVSQTVC